jgi:hypothetical protein
VRAINMSADGIDGGQHRRFIQPVHWQRR